MCRRLHLLFWGNSVENLRSGASFGFSINGKSVLAKRQNKDMDTQAQREDGQGLTFYKGLEINISAFTSCAVSVIATQLCHCSKKTNKQTDKQTNKKNQPLTKHK